MCVVKPVPIRPPVPKLHHYTMRGKTGVVMALNLKNVDVERLASEVARLTGETKTEAIRRALEERRRRLTAPTGEARRQRVLRYLKAKVWSKVPVQQRGRRLTRAEEDAILGYGPEGV